MEDPVWGSDIRQANRLQPRAANEQRHLHKSFRIQHLRCDSPATRALLAVDLDLPSTLPPALPQSPRQREQIRCPDDRPAHFSRDSYADPILPPQRL